MTSRNDSTRPVQRPPHSPIATVVTGGLLLAGVWFLLAPFVWNYDTTGADRGSAPLWNDLGVGVVITLVALALLIHNVTGALSRAVVSFAGVLVGAWATIAPFALRYRLTTEPAVATLNDVIAGVLVTALALAALATPTDEWDPTPQ